MRRGIWREARGAITAAEELTGNGRMGFEGACTSSSMSYA